tara:strand:- start:554 stop:799 length:246 start_codon:yes stop_codon:yes gene_type:complete
MKGTTTMKESATKDSVLAMCEWGTVYRDGSFVNSAGTYISMQEMQKIKHSYRNTNRLHKPYSVLFYTDVMNGKKSNWEQDQ